MSSLTTYLPIFLTTSCFLLALNRVAFKIGLVDRPGDRKSHDKDTPVTGGIAIFAGLLLSVFICYEAPPVKLLWMVSIAFGLLVIGTIDDVVNLTPRVRLLCHVLAGLAMIYGGGVRIETFGEVLFGSSLNLGYFSVPVTLFAVIAAVNALNMMDGLDGLAGGLCLITLYLMVFANILAGHSLYTPMILALSVSIMAFLWLNFRFPWKARASVFLGDAGSTVLGFLLAWLLIDLSQGPEASIEPVSALWFFAMPLLDTFAVIIRRLRAGKSPLSPDQDHIHHLLNKCGINVRTTVLIIYALAAIFGVLGYLPIENKDTSMIIFGFFPFLALCYVCFLSAMVKANGRPELVLKPKGKNSRFSRRRSKVGEAPRKVA